MTPLPIDNVRSFQTRTSYVKGAAVAYLQGLGLGLGLIYESLGWTGEIHYNRFWINVDISSTERGEKSFAHFHTDCRSGKSWGKNSYSYFTNDLRMRYDMIYIQGRRGFLPPPTRWHQQQYWLIAARRCDQLYLSCFNTWFMTCKCSGSPTTSGCHHFQHVRYAKPVFATKCNVAKGKFKKLKFHRARGTTACSAPYCQASINYSIGLSVQFLFFT